MNVFFCLFIKQNTPQQPKISQLVHKTRDNLYFNKTNLVGITFAI